MKNFYLLFALWLPFAPGMLQAQTVIYSQPIHEVGVNLRGATHILGTITAQLPSDGYVVVHFDGECYASVGDLIVVAASQDGEWKTNDGNISIETSQQGFGRPFSHTRVYPVSAGSHTYYAVGQNFVETDGSGVATIYGTLTVEYFPDSGTSKVKSTGFVFNGDVTNTTVVKEQTIHVNAPGKVLVRFDGFITSSPADRIVLAASNTMNWSFNDGNVAVEAVNEGDVDENSFSHTRVYNVNGAGDYTFYAVSQVYGKAGGSGNIWVYGNLLLEYFPTEAPDKIFFSGFTLPTIDLNGQPKTLTSISINAPKSGKVMVVLDGYLTADPGYDIVLAASNNGDWTVDDGNITLQALDLDQNRYSFSHSRVYNVSAGNHTYYAVGEIIGGSGGKTADLFGALTVKYFPDASTAVSDVTQNNSFAVYPNPSTDLVTVTFNKNADRAKKIEVLDLYGRVLKEYDNPANEEMRLDLSTLPSNLYWIRVGVQLQPVIRN